MRTVTVRIDLDVYQKMSFVAARERSKISGLLSNAVEEYLHKRGWNAESIQAAKRQDLASRKKESSK